MSELLMHPVVRGAIAGAVAASAIDIQAFRSFKSATDLKTYSWSLALFRWVQGAVFGALTALGITAGV